MYKLENTVQKKKGERRIHLGVVCVLKKQKQKQNKKNKKYS
jgi:hypothetical protein